VFFVLLFFEMVVSVWDLWDVYKWRWDGGWVRIS